MNGPENVALVPSGVNNAKGKLYSNALKGKASEPNLHRDEYIRLSYPTAKETAGKLDKAFGKHSIIINAADHLHKTLKAAKIPGLPPEEG